MTKISQYQEIVTPDVDDLLIGTDVENSNATKNFTIQSIIDLVSDVGGIGPQGPQGVQGPAGPLGPVGPAGLNWQGAWVSGTSYVADDAVGYGGASWFCILATSGTTTPNLATTNWALLASQGAQGIQGVQGPTGAQGPAGAQGEPYNPNELVIERTDGYILTSADSGKIIIFKTTAAQTLTIPTGLVAGFECTFVTLAGVTLTVSAGSNILNNATSTTMLPQLSFTLKRMLATNTYIVAGSL
jgi:hypothetical protein